MAPRLITDRSAVLALQQVGACAGRPDAWIFDAKTAAEAAYALTFCAVCPAWELCYQVVQPRASHYDGVCAGKVWVNGEPVDDGVVYRGRRRRRRRVS